MGIIRRDSMTITILSYVGVLIGFVNKILLFPNFLSEEQVGLANILVSLAMMYAQFSALGVNSMVVKYFPFFRTADKKHNGLFFWSAMGISTGFLLFTALFLLFREPVTAWFVRESPLLARHYLLLIPLGLTTLFSNFFTSWLQALRKTVISSAAIDIVLRLLITAGISLYALGMMDFGTFIIVYVLIHFVPTLLLLLYTRQIRQAGIQPVATARTRRLIAIAGTYGLWQYFGGASVYLTNVIDQTMLAGMEGLMQGGIFSVMMYMVSTMMIPYRSTVKVATPAVAGLWKERDMAGMGKLHREISAANLVAACFIFLMIWVNLDNIFSLMPASYAAGRHVFLFLGLGRIFETYTGVTGVILVTSKRYRWDFSFSILLVGLTVGTNALLIPRLGMTGAALATMTTLVAYNLLRIGLVWKFFRLQPFAPRDLLVAALTGTCVWLSAAIPYLGHFAVDAAVRSIAVVILFAVPVYLLKISPQLNAAVNDLLRKAGICRRK